MIIGITGRAGSGKDTVARMIQYHSIKDLIPDSGFEDFIRRDSYILGDWQIKKFADPVYKIASTILSKPVEELKTREFKEGKLSEKWWKYAGIPNIVDKDSSTNDGESRLNSPTGRDLLISIGHGMREKLHPDIWVDSLFNDYPTEMTKILPPKNETYLGYKILNIEVILNKQKWIITDVRYDNEARKIKKLGGLILEIVRPSIDKIKHPSEEGVSIFDYKIYNKGTLRDLFDMSREFYNSMIKK